MIIRDGTAITAIRYSVASEILIALMFLQGRNWFDPEVEFSIHGIEPFDEVRSKGWAGEWGTSAQVDLAFYLEDVCKELEEKDQEFSQEWYYAKVANLYFSDIEIPDVAMTVGILLSQMWWKMDLEDVAARGSANLESLEKASVAKKIKSVRQS